MAFVKPPAYRDRNGNTVHATIAVIMKTSADFDAEAFVRKTTPKGAIVRKSELPVVVPGAAGYELLAGEMYPHLGGAHLVMTTVERPCPPAPGVALEAPVKWELEADGRPRYLRPAKVPMRINRPIHYIFLLDIAVSVYEEAVQDYLKFINDMTILE